MITSNLRILMAKKGIKTLRELSRIANISWKVISNLDNNVDIDTIQLRNLLKICSALECSLDELIKIDYNNLQNTDS
ncbi:MAG: Cro/C1-type DNA-binding domain [Clostridiaceae bacterium]|nr:Cro/C1-type DNA-binding domain [Clostridiaceae bacterium]